MFILSGPAAGVVTVLANGTQSVAGVDALGDEHSLLAQVERMLPSKGVVEWMQYVCPLNKRGGVLQDKYLEVCISPSEWCH